MSENESVLFWTFCQLLSEKPQLYEISLFETIDKVLCKFVKLSCLNTQTVSLTDGNMDR